METKIEKRNMRYFFSSLVFLLIINVFLILVVFSLGKVYREQLDHLTNQNDILTRKVGDYESALYKRGWLKVNINKKGNLEIGIEDEK